MRGPGRRVQQARGELHAGAVVVSAVVRLHKAHVVDVLVDLVVLTDRLLVVRLRVRLDTTKYAT